ncbi:unnamed protein product [Lampetra fluviatilis]
MIAGVTKLPPSARAEEPVTATAKIHRLTPRLPVHIPSARTAAFGGGDHKSPGAIHELDASEPPSVIVFDVQMSHQRSSQTRFEPVLGRTCQTFRGKASCHGNATAAAAAASLSSATGREVVPMSISC